MLAAFDQYGHGAVFKRDSLDVVRAFVPGGDGAGAGNEVDERAVSNNLGRMIFVLRQEFCLRPGRPRRGCLAPEDASQK